MTQRTDASRESPGSRVESSRSSPDDSARTPTLLTPWHDLDRLARALIDARATYAALDENASDYDAMMVLVRAEREYNTAFTPERILSLLDAATQGAEDTARLDWWDRSPVDGPFAGVFTDGRLGLFRGHVVDTRWTYKGAPLPLRDAIDAARAVPPALDGPAGAVQVHEQHEDKTAKGQRESSSTQDATVPNG